MVKERESTCAFHHDVETHGTGRADVLDVGSLAEGVIHTSRLTDAIGMRWQDDTSTFARIER